MARRTGSPRGHMNWQDVLNSLKHVGLVAAASVLTPLASGAPLDLAALQTAGTTALATGLLTLVARLAQDNR